MSNATINGIRLFELFTGGFQNLQKNEKTIDALNVFPVPDGDTGSNMVMTLSGGIASGMQIDSASDMMRSFSKGTLYSARGNSGVILSQFIKGFSEGVKEKEKISPYDFITAMESGVDFAYKSVIKPVEGTMLTVLREASEDLRAACDSVKSFSALFDLVTVAMKKSLNSTPEKLAILKESGVVDSGGAGLLCIFEGMKGIIEGKKITDMPEYSEPQKNIVGKLDSNTRLEYGYCTEFILQLMSYKTDIKSFELSTLTQFLESIGDSVVAVMDEDIVKVHVHTFVPEKILEFAHKFGEFATLKIENMTLQHSETKEQAKPKEHKKFAIVTTANGDGLANTFKEIGADIVVSGGQTQNPSTEDFIKAFKELDAEHIIVLPNNKNIVMAASQAAQLYDKTDVRVLKTCSVAEGYSALSMLDPFAKTIEEFLAPLEMAKNGVTTGYVTVATRDTNINSTEIKKGSYIGLDNNTVLCAEEDKLTAAIKLIKNMPDISSKETIIAFCGSDVTEEERYQLEEELTEEFPLFDIGFIDGGQPVYSFIFSVE